MKQFLLSIACLLSLSIRSQEIKGSRSGMFSLGTRSTASLFNHGSWNNSGIGAGGQFRIQLSDRINTDWFFDYINGNLDDYANREDYHIGWSVLFYPFKPKEILSKVQPYILAGHCFDYTNITDNRNAANFAERWSSAVQGGVGAHFNLTQRTDISLTSQYMIHMGNAVHAHKHNGLVEIHEEKGVDLEGHLLFTLSVNIKLVDLWRK